jgi:glycosyltransferase involved in cell wall biosynthesis
MEERLNGTAQKAGRSVVSGIMFSPRGGSAHVARALMKELGGRGWSVRLVSGSRSDRGDDADAEAFYSGIDLRPVDFAPALREPDPLRPPPGMVPMHPSFEQRPAAPDPVFALLDDADFERQVGAWAEQLDLAGAADADVLYLHHLTPLNEAAARIAPDVPVIGHLHGTELLMLEQIDDGAPAEWAFAAKWAERLREWARACEQLLVSPAGLERARKLLGVEIERLVPLPNGFDPDVFHPLEVDRDAHWRRHLVERPTALLPSGRVLAYRDRDIEPLRAGTILLYVGRFTKVKRLPFLLQAFADARERFEHPAALVMVGGHPGEWEGEHPANTISRLGLSDAFLAGWQPQEALPEFIRAADAVILPSDREQFGQTLVEGMACGRPGIAANVLGPAGILEDGETGWLFESEDRAALTEALVEAVDDPGERRRRGERALEAARARFAWPSIATRLDQVLGETAAEFAGPLAEASTIHGDE